ncbi:MAG: RNA polymerase sigma factor [Lachnospiraceae bacterium]|nr:RNA polymerase sigma factor [Lachnospiraceae bacterium]
MDSDSFLLRRMKNGDEAAIEEFVRKYYPVILKYCRYHIYDVNYAEDVTQETFERFFRTLPDYRHYGKAANYLYVIAGNLCRDFYRREQQRGLEQRLEDTRPGEAGGGNGSQLGRDDPFGAVDRQMDVRQAVAALPRELQEVVVLYYFQELKIREIAAILEIGIPLVKYRLKKAKEQLGGLLER